MNKNLFNSHLNTTSSLVKNEAGGQAFALTTEEALAQLILTGTFNGTYYTSAEKQLEALKELLKKVNNPKFVAQLAIYARHHGFMKDTPAYLTAWLSVHAPQYLTPVFDSVIDNGKMLRNFVQVMRSGVIDGRKSLGSRPKKLIQNWLNSASERTLIQSLVGNPSLKDIIKMVHPKAKDVLHNAMYNWIVNEDVNEEVFYCLPTDIRNLILLRRGYSDFIPNVPYELVSNLELSQEQWKHIVIIGGWHFIRMNLNTFERKGLYSDKSVVDFIADKLRDENLIRKSKVMPYQLLTTCLNISENVPLPIVSALNDAINISCENVPVIDGNTWIFVDVSGSMAQPITGSRKGSTSKMTCAHIAALFTSALLKTNPRNTNILMFDTKLNQSNRINPHNSIVDNCEKIISYSNGGGTCCELPLEYVAENVGDIDTIIYISDNQSWFGPWNNRTMTRSMRAWNRYKTVHNPNAKMICIDIQPYTTTQVPSDESVFNIGGFSDEVFTLIEKIVNNRSESWIQIIQDAVQL